MLLQYGLQCKCPRESEEFRFPGADILASACESFETKKSRLGQELRNGYLGSFGLFGEWVLALEPGNTAPIQNYSLLNVQDGQRIMLNRARTTGYGQIQSQVLEALHSAQKVSVLGVTDGGYTNLQLVIALSKDFVSSDDNWLVESNQGRVDEILGTLQREKIKYESANIIELTSHNHLFRSKGNIELTSNGRIITHGLEGGGRFQRGGWASEDRGVIYHGGSMDGPFLFGSSLAVSVPTGPRVPQPLLLLKVPKEYLPQHLQQEFETNEMQARAAKEKGDFQLKLTLGIFFILAILATTWCIWIALRIVRRWNATRTRVSV